jgi:HD-GYP domain-containing protein (c-di-GMP phosphodiesterase class II)/HAMP domain-containing protein
MKKTTTSRLPKQGFRLRLHTKFIIGIILLECLLMSATILVVEHRMRESILDEFLKRGLSVAKNLAAMNTSYVATYNYVSIEQSVEQITEDNGLTYAIVMLFDGEVAAFGGKHGIRDEVLGNGVHERALKADKALVQYIRLTGSEYEICDVAVPILVKDEKWGTVRVGFSLENMHAAILKTRTTLFLLGLIALIAGCLGSLLLARRIARPIGALVSSVEAISKGDYKREIDIGTSDEIGYLGLRFAAMQETLSEQIQLLTDTNLELKQSNKRLQSLFQVSQAMNSFANLEKLYDLILEASLDATGALGGSLTLLDKDQKPRVVATSGIENLEESSTEPIVGSFMEDSTSSQYQSFLVDAGVRPLLLELEQVRDDMPFFSIKLESNPELELLSIPLKGIDNLLGYLNLLRKRKHGTAHPSEMQTLSVLANNATAAIENKELFGQLEEAYLSSIKSLAKSLEFKDEYTHGHAERVAEVCMKIAVRMEMDDKSLKILYNAALLHDIGKIGVIENILNKGSSLDREEWINIKKHPVFGEEILRPIFSLKEEAKIVRHHHEREDGKGYPDGLYGNKLTLAEKIIIVADAYDAMNSKRAYRAPFDPASIRNELQANKGSQFDSEVVDVFLEILEEEVKTPLSTSQSHKVVPFQIIAPNAQ